MNLEERIEYVDKELAADGEKVAALESELAEATPGSARDKLTRKIASLGGRKRHLEDKRAEFVARLEVESEAKATPEADNGDGIGSL